MPYLAIDQGTSGTKALVYSEEGVATAEVALQPSYGSDGSAQIAPTDILESIVTAAMSAIEQAGVTASDIVRVGLGNQGESVLAWDPDTGEAFTPVVLWQDKRSQGTIAPLRRHAETIANRTGLELDCYFSAPKMRWIREQLTTDGIVTNLDSWLTYQLTGELVTDAATASRSLIYDLDSRDWSAELTDLFGLSSERLPQIVRNDAIVGVTDAFGAPIEVGGLIVDQPAALLSQSCLQSGTAKCTFGTGAFLLANIGSRPLRHKNRLTTSVGWDVAEGAAYYFDGQVFTAGSAINWLIRLGVLAEASEIDHVIAARGNELCVPALAGLGAPRWQPEARGVFSGLSLSTERGELVRALVDGLAAQVAELLDAMQHGTSVRIDTLRVDGGLTRSRSLMQAVADIAGIPVEVYASPHATALGVVALARLAGEPDLAIADAIPAWAPAHRYEPTSDRANIAEFRTRWQHAARYAEGA